MVARLKLKEIDGRAPPGVNAMALRLRAALRGEWCPGNASPPAAAGGQHAQIAGTP